jgi:thiamine-monophosphate kinase
VLGSAATIAELTERELIARIHARLPRPPACLIVGIGDDGAVVEAERNRLQVLTVDALVDGVHFDTSFTPPDAIGHRALAVNLSDIAAMGAEPRLALVSLALPVALSCDAFDGIVSGLTALAARERVSIAGGNITRTPGPLTVDITVIGTVKRRQVLTRSGARPGDVLYVSGAIGAAGAGLAMLRAGDSRESSCVERYLFPNPRIRVGLLLGRNRAASACIDLSDGLAEAAHQLAEASNVGLTIEAESVPIDAATRSWFSTRGADALNAAAAAGDDYELLFTVRPRLRGRLAAAVRHSQIPLTRIGVCTSGPDVVVRREIDGRAVDAPFPRGFAHFR